MIGIHYAGGGENSQPKKVFQKSVGFGAACL